MTGDPEPVTVVIATRDRPVMLREALQSVLSQDYAGSIEVIVVFDRAPADDSLRVSGCHRTVRVVENSRNPGLAGARNTGILLAETRYVAFCDDDDYWLTTKLTRQVAAMEGQPDSLLSTLGITVEYDGDRFERILDRSCVTFEDLLRDRLAELHPSTFLMRRGNNRDDAFLLVDEEVPGGFGEDYDFLLRASRRHPIVNIAEALVVVRWGAQSFFFRRWNTMAEGLAWLLARYPEFESVPRGAARVRGQIAFAEAAMGNRASALRWAGLALRSNPGEGRAFLATAVAAHLLSADRVMVTLHRRGRGI